MTRESDPIQEITAFGTQLEEDVKVMCEHHKAVSDSIEDLRKFVAAAASDERPVRRTSWIRQLLFGRTVAASTPPPEVLPKRRR